MQVVEYVDIAGFRPFSFWLDTVKAPAASKVKTGVARLQLGNLSNVKPVGSGVSEYRIDFGPGYRIYFGLDGEEFVVLLGGGTKKRQQQDIEEAIERWRDYKRRKREQHASYA